LELDVWFNKTDKMLSQEENLQKQAQDLMTTEFINLVQIHHEPERQNFFLPLTILITVTILLLISVGVAICRFKGNKVISKPTQE